ncbi:MAG: 16S rRNA (cytosine(1402)-N(4))-methyltransferase RsmH [Clostridia bacterium]|nr:16S rRNA (cytosine(1402)-N(4))-methyltransferase RsmH [Clostridia bacterium]
MEYKHITVLLNETVESVLTDVNGTYIDCTLGGGGHTGLLLSRLSERGRVIAIDRDDVALENARNKFNDPRLTLVKSNFSDIGRIAAEYAPEGVDGILADLGISSPQVDDPTRGFSYSADAFLDMRMDQTQAFTAYDVVNTYSREDLIRILRDYGEERFAGRIADKILRAREQKPIDTTAELTAIVAAAMPRQNKKEGHPCKRTYQAIRIEVNSELSSISAMIAGGIPCLKSGGRMSIISFHSLEDRIVKNAFATGENPCTCPKDFPICVCGKKPTVKVLTRKPLLPSEQEITDNNRAHSAKLRVCEKL